jgi:hypothetical protein
MRMKRDMSNSNSIKLGVLSQVGLEPVLYSCKKANSNARFGVAI